MTESDMLDDLTDQFLNLEMNADSAGATTAIFSKTIENLGSQTRQTDAVAATFGKTLHGSLKTGFMSVLSGERDASAALRKLGQKMSDTFYDMAMQPVLDKISGGLLPFAGSLFSQSHSNGGGSGDGGFGKFAGLLSGILSSASGNPFSMAGLIPFAKGGIVSQAAAFPMRGGVGLMGEAGPEAIMPLARGADGRLGVKAAGGASPNVVMNIQTRDAESFHRSRSQIAADVSRALARGQRNR